MSNADDASPQHGADYPTSNLHQKKLNEFLHPKWLRAHNKSANNPKSTTNQRDVVNLSDSPRPISQADDVASIYYAGDMGCGADENIDALNDLLNYLDPAEAGPSRLGVGKGKDINKYEEVMRENAEPTDDEISSECEDKEEDDNDDEEVDVPKEVLSVSPLHYAMELPSPPNNPYRPEIYENELDLDFGEDFDEDEKANVRKAHQIISCAGLASKLSSEEIMYLIEYFNLEGKWLRPRSFMRMHVFNTSGLLVPRMVLSKNLVELGFGSPMHPFLHSIIDYYKIAPIQLSPNSYRAVLDLYMMYRNKEYEAPTMEEISYFLQIRRAPNDLGFFYVAFWPKHNKKGFSTGNPSNMKIWKIDYFYLYDVPRVMTQFNLSPYKPVQTALLGDALLRAESIAALPKQEKDLDLLVTPDSLLYHGFYNDGYKQIPKIKFKRNMTKKTRRKQISVLTGKGVMVRLPFGQNPFAETAHAPSSGIRPRPTASFLARQTLPPVTEKEDQVQQKRKNPVDTAKQPNKKNKTNTAESDASPESASSLFGSLASENFPENDVKMWKGRSDSDAEFNFKLGLGDAFYHGLTLMNQKNSMIQDQRRAINRYKDDILTLKGQVTDYHTKYLDEVKARRDDDVKAQSTIDQFQTEAKQAQELLEGENSRLQAKIDDLEAAAKKREGDAYSMGYLDYLRNFLVTDSDYDWSPHFAPSTPDFISQFKEENSSQIIEVRALLDDQIKKELAKLEAEKAGSKGENPPETQNQSGASPSDQAAS